MKTQPRPGRRKGSHPRVRAYVITALGYQALREAEDIENRERARAYLFAPLPWDESKPQPLPRAA